jgi:hypothetical protein
MWVGRGIDKWSRWSGRRFSINDPLSKTLNLKMTLNVGRESEDGEGQGYLRSSKWREVVKDGVAPDLRTGDLVAFLQR